ncbi:MAG: FAD-dependent oxidoreductase [Bdellovibrionota bacterium]
MSENSSITDVAIIGSGFFGACTALLLAEQGYSVTLITQGRKPLDSVLNSLGVLWPSLNDPPTRADVAHGHDVACYLNNFCQLGIEFFCQHFLPLLDNIWQKSTCLRVGVQNFEQEELEKAKNLGFGLKTTNKKEIYLENNSAYICTQPVLFQEKFIKLLQKNNVQILNEAASAITEERAGCTVTLTSCVLKSEIIVLANGVQISSLLPKYKSILVPMSDVLIEYECATQKSCSPVTLRASNGHVAASLFLKENKTVLKITGPRFLLPQAGVGLVLNKEDIQSKSIDSVQKFHKQIFSILSSYYKYPSVDSFLADFPFQQTNYFVSVDCHPCDELPLVGEFGKLGKILGCTGFLATGFSSGVWGAKIIYDLICQDKSLDLHARLKPRRFYRTT